MRIEEAKALLEQAKHRMPTSDRPSSSAHPMAAFAGLFGAKARRKMENAAPAYLAVLVLLAEAAERQQEILAYGSSTRWCEVHEAVASPERYHDDRCSASRKCGECYFSPDRPTMEEALAAFEAL